MSRWICTIVFMLLGAARAQITTAPSSQPSDDFAQRLEAIDRLAAQHQAITADFVQEKQSPLLRKPLVSRGTVRAKGGLALWKTTDPEPSEMSVGAQTLRIYYPKQKTIEEYSMQQQLGMLAASPLPRLDTIRQSFSTTRADGSGGDIVIVRLEPRDVELRKYVDHVRVTLDALRGVVTEFELIDPDGEQTIIRFSNIRTDGDLSDEALKINAPVGTKVVRPLEGAPSR
jgi:outer membrane lipoprotein-sorting protein